MKNLMFGILFSLVPIFAAADVSIEPLLNKITLQLSGEQWVSTKTALVNVRINAAVADLGIENVQNSVMSKLNQLSNQGEWHVLSFDRQLDKSGLESIQIMAQTRLPQTELANLRNKAKTISKAGETYTIDSVQFVPSEEEIRQANVLLRNTIYQQAKAEIDALNKLYPEQKYYLHQIDFATLSNPQPMAREMVAMTEPAAGHAVTPLQVGNKVNVQATVVAASLNDQTLQKLAH